ncbi:fermentation-respiration switch protein FrsA (DUF1100 family) [Alkalihalobacillus xiaoxiensis]|uniref:Fermentation-respiration switch protein FrsA (DUF1100 family) n=1 Tax=Shouchella xiaoxiensis TaxID=766895 RepID=A0ABS2SZV8_9BACI|nr:fermentation-respiration switch protein FrsA (DUF1100 family) [Shouchella xiaoxiensis]
MKKLNKKTAFALSGTLLTGVLLGATEYFYRTAIKRTVVDDDREALFFEKFGIEQQKEEDEAWLNKQALTEVAITSNDGLQLKATYIPARMETLKCVILAHGYGGKGEEMYGFARLYAESLNYNVLIPDARGHGKSEGDYIGFGWHERKDYLKWIHYLLARHGRQALIALHGISMGGATVLMTSGEELPMQVKAIVADCAYTSTSEILTHQLKQMYQLPAFPFLPLASLYTRLRSGFSFYEASALKQVQQAHVPILFFHGDQDKVVPVEMVYRLSETAPEGSERVVVSGAEHGMAYRTDSVQYEDKLRGFLARNIR